MRQNDRRRRLFKTFTACLLAIAMLLSNVGAANVWAAGIDAPTIDKVFYDATTISGAGVHVARVSGKLTRGTVHVTLKDKNAAVKADNLTFTPKSGTKWTVKLPEGVTIAEGDTVTAYQEFDGQKSPDATANAEPSKAYDNKDKLKMPTGEIYIEQTSSNQVNDDEQAEAVKMLKDANTDIAGDIKSVKFSIDGIEHAYYEVTYDDGSKSGKVKATNLQIKKVTEYSRGATLGSITIVDNVIKGQLLGEGPFDGIKVQILLKLSDAVKGSYCDKGKCLTDKDTSNPVDATVDGTTGKFTYTIQNPDLKLDQVVGVTVKEKNKFKSCSSTTVKPVTVGKTEVKDPRKLTADDKKAIDAAIRKAYTVGDTSKLPNGTADKDGVPAVIQFDDSGNVKIFSGNDVAGTWDPANDYKFVPEKNEDGSYKLNDGAQPKITIAAKDILKNIKPDAPAVAVDTDTGKVTITPPAYKDPGDDTDLLSYTITYKDNSGAEKTVTATRDLDTNKWSGTGVDADTGVITLSVEKIELAGTVKATAKDNGGLEGDTDKLDSDPATKKLETATVSYDANKGTGDMESKNLNKGSKYKLLPNGFTAPENKEFDGWTVNGEDKKVGDEITVNENTTVTAKWKDNMVDVTFASNGGGGSMDKATVKKGSTYKLPDNKFTAPENKEFDGWTVNGEDKKVGDEITVNENTTVTAKWKEKAPVIEEFKVKFIANGGTGSMKDLTVKKGASFKLPPNKFTAPEGKEFDGWDVNGRKFTVGTEVTVSGDGNMKVKALWRDKGTPGTPDPQDPANPEKPAEQPKNHYYKGSTLIIPNRTPEPVEPAKEMEIGRHIRYLYGYEDRTVRPQGKITRAEAAALIARLAELDMSDKSKPDFADTPSAWYNSAINIMVKKDLMFGDKNGNFRPNEPITRGEFARALLYIDRANDKVAPFADVKGHQFEAAINQAFGNGRINGYPDGTFRPDDYIQRAEAARMLNQYANRGTTLEGMAPVAKDLARFTDIDESHWAYCEIMEAANSHEYQRVKGTQAETWLKILYDDMKK